MLIPYLVTASSNHGRLVIIAMELVLLIVPPLRPFGINDGHCRPLNCPSTSETNIRTKLIHVTYGSIEPRIDLPNHLLCHWRSSHPSNEILQAWCFRRIVITRQPLQIIVHGFERSSVSREDFPICVSAKLSDIIRLGQ